MATETETSKRALAKHTLITVNGGETEDETEADGIGYKHLRTNGSFSWAWSEANEAERKMLAIFGAKTLCTNEASQVKQKTGTEVDPTPMIAERFALIRSGAWVDRTREGFAVNLDALAGALFDVLTGKGHAADYQTLRDKMESDKDFVKKVKSNTEVNAKYIERVGRPTASIDELAGMLA